MKALKLLLIIILPVGCQTTNPASDKSDKEHVFDVVQPPLNFQTSAKLHGDLFQTSDVHGEVWWAHIMFNGHPSDSVMEDEIRWWIYDIWQDNQTSDGIIVTCLDSASGDSFCTAHFAPNGKMSDVEDNTPYQNFKVNIQLNK